MLLQNTQGTAVSEGVPETTEDGHRTSGIPSVEGNINAVQVKVSVTMPKLKGRSTYRASWSEENMKKAIQDVLDRTFSERAAADRYQVPRTSLQDRIKAIKQGHQITLKTKLGLFTKAARLEIANNGFRCMGIQPFNRDVFLDLDFLGSALTDTPAEYRSHKSTIQVPIPAVVPEDEPEASTSILPVTSTTFQEAVASTSVDVKKVNDALKILSPLPDASNKRLLARKRRTHKSEILTSSPYKNELIKKAQAPIHLAKVKKNMET
ncbi:hypothetical protein ILUMI_23508 [Ignelater luminosus]|uniref:HTH psq-type domain-containing protein n=1 Tax=Ignelater luminosus TaxID=2038154 RepID=A0A8K0C7Z0_IGNLU|nr:hypothetical protein ILUMI_23508 [Ignelater luminosus]